MEVLTESDYTGIVEGSAVAGEFRVLGYADRGHSAVVTLANAGSNAQYS